MADEVKETKETKKWYESKTVWFNLLAVGALIVQTQTGAVVSVEEQAGIITVVNLILRMTTSSALSK